MNKYLNEFLSYGFLLALISSLAGCMTQSFPIPEVLKDQGLLVAEITTDQAYFIYNSTPKINGKEYKNSIQQNHMLIALDPGQYTFENLYATSMFSTLFTFPLKQNFTIESGKTTNLGHILIQSKSNSTGQKGGISFDVIKLDNSYEMTTFIRETQPKLYASLVQKTAVTAPGSYLNAAQTNQFRYILATKIIQAKNWAGKLDKTRGYVTGELGTLARLIRNDSGVITGLKVLETNTLTNLTECNGTEKILACLKSSTEYFVAIDEKIVHRTFPAGVSVNSMMAFSESGLVAVDISMNVYTTLDSGQTWKKFDKAALKEPLDAGYKIADPRHLFSFHKAVKGFYIYHKTRAAKGFYIYNQNSISIPKLLYADYLTATIQHFNLPSSVEEVSNIYETDAGIYLGPKSTLSNGKIHFLPKGRENWVALTIPHSGCEQVIFPDVSGKKFQVLCHGLSLKVLVTNDGGINWTSILEENSLFKKN